jgi:hypothetical protein
MKCIHQKIIDDLRLTLAPAEWVLSDVQAPHFTGPPLFRSDLRDPKIGLIAQSFKNVFSHVAVTCAPKH